jgi:hypothetical protein
MAKLKKGDTAGGNADIPSRRSQPARQDYLHIGFRGSAETAARASVVFGDAPDPMQSSARITLG